MAKDFDIFLHRHLTECDLLIQSIPFRDGISVTDRIILDACLQGCKLLRIASAQSNVDVTAKLDKMIKTCCEKLGTSTTMAASVDLKALAIISSVNAPMNISVENLGTLATVLNEVEAGMSMCVAPLITRIAKSLGDISTPMGLCSNVTDTLKRSLITLYSSTSLDTGLDGDLKTGLLNANAELSIDATLSNLCSRIGFDAVAGIEMTAIILGTKLSNSLGRAIGGITIDSEVAGTKARKMEAVSGIVQLMTDVIPVLVKLIYPVGNEITLQASIAGAELKRYRVLDEMDGYTLEEFSDVSLNDVDYIIL